MVDYLSSKKTFKYLLIISLSILIIFFTSQNSKSVFAQNPINIPGAPPPPPSNPVQITTPPPSNPIQIPAPPAPPPAAPPAPSQPTPPPPVVNIPPPVVNVPPPTVNVPAPIVNVPAPIINVPAPTIVIPPPPPPMHQNTNVGVSNSNANSNNNANISRSGSSSVAIGGAGGSANVNISGTVVTQPSTITYSERSSAYVQPAIKVAGVSQVAQLPKTGLPSIVWSLLILIPLGTILKGYKSGIKHMKVVNPLYIFENKKFAQRNFS